MSAGQYWLKGTACLRYIVNSPDRLRWGYHEQSYRVNRIQQKEKNMALSCRSYGPRNRLKNIVFENDAHRNKKS